MKGERFQEEREIFLGGSRYVSMPRERISAVRRQRGTAQLEEREGSIQQACSVRLLPLKFLTSAAGAEERPMLRLQHNDIGMKAQPSEKRSFPSGRLVHLLILSINGSTAANVSE